MIVLFRGYGDHSNRLFQNLHLEAFCLEHGIQFANPTLNDLCQYYRSAVRSDKRLVSWLLRTSGASLLRRAGRLGSVITLDQEGDSAEWLLAKEKGRLLFVEGWAFRVFALTKKYQNHLAAKYSLKREYYSGNSTLERITAVDRDRRALVAVHIRRGDYRSWREGAFHFEDDTYRLYMAATAAAIRKQLDKDTVFAVFSDETTSFVDSAQVIVSENPWYLDHHLMSRCDYIIGPPSTFSLWASYTGRTRYFHFADSSGEIDLRRFKYCIG